MRKIVSVIRVQIQANRLCSLCNHVLGKVVKDSLLSQEKLCFFGFIWQTSQEKSDSLFTSLKNAIGYLFPKNNQGTANLVINKKGNFRDPWLFLFNELSEKVDRWCVCIFKYTYLCIQGHREYTRTEIKINPQKRKIIDQDI